MRFDAAMRSPSVKVLASESASKIIKNMLKENVGSALVLEDNGLIGMITEKDILNEVVAAKRNPENTFAKEIMSAPVVTIDANVPLLGAFEVMRNNGVRRLAVTKTGVVVGILTERRALNKLNYLITHKLESR